MQHDLALFLLDYPDATEIPLECVLEFVDKVVATTRGTFVASINTQTVLRLAGNISLPREGNENRCDLTTINPLKAEREDLIPPSAKDAAKRNLELS